MSKTNRTIIYHVRFERFITFQACCLHSILGIEPNVIGFLDQHFVGFLKSFPLVGCEIMSLHDLHKISNVMHAEGRPK
jgi:hypothetical protein